MPRKPTGQDGHQALRDHIVEKATSARLQYGLYIDEAAIMQMLDDRSIVRHPVSVTFDASSLMPGEFAHAEMIGGLPGDGYRLAIHPHFQARHDILPLLIAYHLVDINYGEVASAAEAELFGATLLGMDIDAYYQALCELADSIPPP